MIAEKDIQEAKELLKEGYINLTLWRKLVAIEQVYLYGEKHQGGSDD